jgi:hypothetical protein
MKIGAVQGRVQEILPQIKGRVLFQAAACISLIGVLVFFLGVEFGNEESSPVVALSQPEEPTEALKASIALKRSHFLSPQNRFESHVSQELLERILRDEEHKINPEFQVYDEFRVPTRFWLKIYSQYSSKDVVIYDGKNMDLIYDVVDLRPIEAKSRNAVVFEILSERKVKQTVSAFQKALVQLSHNPHPLHPTAEQSKILLAWSQAHPQASAASKTSVAHQTALTGGRLKEMAEQVRTMKGQRDAIIQGLFNGEVYFPKIEEIFRQAEVPVELSRLCLVESSFNPKAGSKVGALGVWQIMPQVGKQYLKMDEKIGIDERLSPIKSSLAAAKLLKFNYKILGSWILAVVAYNHGFKGLPKLKPHTYDFSEIAHLFRTHPSDSKERKEALGFASKNYYSEYLAIMHASLYANEIYGELPALTQVRPFELVRLEQPQSGLEFMESHGLSLEEFTARNPDVRKLDQRLNAGFWLVASAASQSSFASGSAAQLQDWIDTSLKRRPEVARHHAIPHSGAKGQLVAHSVSRAHASAHSQVHPARVQPHHHSSAQHSHLLRQKFHRSKRALHLA